MGAEAATMPRIYVVNAPDDQSLADEVASRLIDWGMVLSGAGLAPRGEHARWGNGGRPAA